MTAAADAALNNDSPSTHTLSPSDPSLVAQCRRLGNSISWMTAKPAFCAKHLTVESYTVIYNSYTYKDSY